jgi:hypothetical protein
MTVTIEPRGLTWLNNVNTTSFESVVSQICWIVGSFAFTFATVWLLMGDTDNKRNAGTLMAGIMVGAWTSKTVAGVVAANNKRKTNPLYKDVLEAKERGAKAGAAAALVLKKDAAAVHTVTAERPAMAAAAAPAPAQQTTVNVAGDT